MEDLESLFTDNDNIVTGPAPVDHSLVTAPNPTVTSQLQWCSSCCVLAKEMEGRYSKNFIAMKQKIFFTDNLIRMYQECKKQLQDAENRLQSMTERYNNSCNEKTLIQAQLKLMLSNQEPSINENTKLQERIQSLESDNVNLKIQLHAMDESRRLHEETLKVLKAQDTVNVHDLRKSHQKKISQLKDEISDKTLANRKLTRKNKHLEARVKKLQAKRTRTSSRSDLSHDEMEHMHVKRRKLSHETEEIQKNGVSRAISQSELDESIVSPRKQNDFALKVPDVTMKPIKSCLPRNDNPTKTIPEKIAFITSNFSDDSDSDSLVSPVKLNQSEDKTPSVLSKPAEAGTSMSVSKNESMKRRMMDMKKKRAVQSFTRWPTEVQLSGLSKSVEKIRKILSEKSDTNKDEVLEKVAHELSSYCSEHYLDENQDLVVKKILKLHKQEFSSEHRKWLQSIVEGNTSANGMVQDISDLSSQENNSQNEAPAIDKKEPETKEADKSEMEATSLPSPEDVILQMPDISHPIEDSSTKEDEEHPVLPVMSETCPESSVVKLYSDSHPEQSDSSSSTRKKRRKESNESNKEKQEEALQPPKPTSVMTRRSTRSMSVEIQSNQQDPAISQLRRSRRISEREEVSSSSSESDPSKRFRHNSSGVKNQKEKGSKIPVPIPEINITKTADSTVDALKAVPIIPIADFRKLDETKSKTEDMKLNIAVDSDSRRRDVQSLLKIEIPPVITESSMFMSSDDDESSNSEVEFSIEASPASRYDVTKILNEMTLPYDAHLSPLPFQEVSEPPKETINLEAENLNIKEQENDSKDMGVGLKEDDEDLGDEQSMPCEEESRGRESISPSTDLCTAISFSSSSKELTKETVKKPLFQSNVESHLKDSSSLNENEERATSSTSSPASLTFSSSSIPTDILKPRRFSCEAPEMAVSVPPMKPMMKSGSFDHVPSPLTLSNRDLRKTASLPPHRKEGEVPAHWHSSVLNQVRDSSKSSDSTSSSLSKHIVMTSEDANHLEENNNEINKDEAEKNLPSEEEFSSGTDASVEPLTNSKDSLDLNFEDVAENEEEEATSATPGMEFDAEEFLKQMENIQALSPMITGIDSDSCNIVQHISSDDKDSIEEEEASFSYQDAIINHVSISADVEEEKEINSPDEFVDVDALKNPSSVNDQDVEMDEDVSNNDLSGETISTESESIVSTSKQIKDGGRKIELSETKKEKCDAQYSTVNDNKSPSTSKIENEDLVMDVSDQELVQEASLENAISLNWEDTVKESSSEDEINVESIDKIVASFLRKKSVNIEVGEEFISHCIDALLANNHRFDLESVLEQDPNADISIDDIPEMEKKFIQQLLALHRTGICRNRFIPGVVLPLLLKLLKHFGHAFPVNFPMAENERNTLEVLYHSLINNTKKQKMKMFTLPQTLTLGRVFGFLCRATKCHEHFLSFARYCTIWQKPSVIVTLIQTLMCWSQGLKTDTMFSQSVCRCIRKVLPAIFNHKIKANALRKQIDWLDKQCGWETNNAGKGDSVALHDLDVNCWLFAVKHCMAAIKSAQFSTELKNFLDSDRNEDVEVSSMSVFDQQTKKALLLLEVLPREKTIDATKTDIFQDRFWPLLNDWSCHLHVHGDVDEGRTVTNASIVAVMEALTSIMSYYIAKQRQQHKNQQTTPQLQMHFEIICTLMDNLSKRYFARAPRLVRCAVGSFLLRTWFCNPEKARKALHGWLEMTKSTGPGHKEHKNLKLLAILSNSSVETIHSLCYWLDRKCSVPEEISLVKLLWPG